MAGELAGYKGDLMLSTSTAGSVARIAGVKDWTIHVANSPIDITSFDSSGDREFIFGLSEWDGSATVVAVTTNATHKQLFDVLNGRIKVTGEFYPTGSSSDGYWSGTCLMQDWSHNAPMEDHLNVSVAFKGTSTLARTSSST